MFAGVVLLLGDQLPPHSIWIWSTVVQDQLWVQEDNGRVMAQAASQLFDLSSLWGSFCEDVVVLTLVTGLPSLLEDRLSHCSIWGRRTVAQN